MGRATLGPSATDRPDCPAECPDDDDDDDAAANINSVADDDCPTNDNSRTYLHNCADRAPDSTTGNHRTADDDNCTYGN